METQIPPLQPPHNSTHSPLRLLLRPEEGAEAIGVSRARFYELMADGTIKSIKIGRSRRVPLSELQKWIATELVAQGAT